MKRATQAAQRTGRQVQEVLTEWLECAAENEEIAQLLPDAEYRIYTPYGNDAAGQALFDFLKEAENNPEQDSQ